MLDWTLLFVATQSLVKKLVSLISIISLLLFFHLSFSLNCTIQIILPNWVFPKLHWYVRIWALFIPNGEEILSTSKDRKVMNIDHTSNKVVVNKQDLSVQVKYKFIQGIEISNRSISWNCKRQSDILKLRKQWVSFTRDQLSEKLHSHTNKATPPLNLWENFYLS